MKRTIENQLYFIASALIAAATLSSCVDVEAPEDLNALSFNGLKEITFEDSATLLRWDQPTKGDATRFHVYMKEVELLGDPFEEPQPMYMDAGELPKTTGTLIKIIDGLEYPLDRELTTGKTYAFQVVAVSGDKVDENQRVLALTEMGQSEADDGVKLSIVGGEIQIQNLNEKFAEPLKVKLTKFDRPLKAEEVKFELVKGTGATLSAVSNYTDEEGIAAVYLTAGSAEESYKVKASYKNKEVFFTAISRAKASTSSSDGSDSSSTDAVVLEIVSGNSQVDDIGSTFDDPLVVKLRDGSTGMAGKSITFGITTMPAGATGTSLSFSTVTTDANGQASISFTAGNLAGTYEITASYESKFVKFSQIATNTSQTPALIVSVAGDSQTPVVNNNLSTPLKVKVTDASAQPIAGVAVNFTAVSGGGAIVTAQPVVTDADGFAETIVKVGTIVTNNIFKAEVVSDTSLNVSFSSLPVAGAPAKLAFSTQPGGAYQDFEFFTQPVVAVQDTYGNLVSTATDTVTLSVKTGTGALSDSDGGAVDMAAVSGVAVFTSVEYDTAESGVILTASASGLSSVDSTSFDVNTLAGACAVEDSSYETADGGCKDLSTGLVWSRPNNSKINWFAAVWDAFATGGAGLSEVEASDNGWTNEYTGSGQDQVCAGGTCDNDSGAYCHTLVEGGKSDWRLPTFAELQTAIGNGLWTHQGNMQNASGTEYWSSTVEPSNNNVYIARPSWSGNYGPFNTRNTICVRNGSGKPAAAKLEFEPWAAGSVAVVNTAFSVTVKVVTASDTQVNAQGTSVTLALANGTGALSGTLTVDTDSRGYAVFSNVLYDTAETIELTASASGLSAPTTNLSVPVSLYPGGCGSPDGQWIDADGGCKEVATGIVWSKISATTMNWHAAIWDMAAGGSAPEASDNGWTNEYVGRGTKPCQRGTSHCDNAAAAYCHDLVEGGESDWVLPDMTLLSSSYTAGLKDQRPLSGKIFWSRDGTSSDGKARFLAGDNGGGSYNWKTANYNVICARGLTPNPTIDEIKFESGALTTAKIPAEVGQTFSLTAAVYATDGGRVRKSGVDVTISLASGTGTLSGTLTQTTDQAGRTFFTDLSYDTAEAIEIAMSNNGGLTNGANAEINVSTMPGACRYDDSIFTTADGGCKHVSSGLVLSKIADNSMSWYAAIWDSANPSGNAAADGDDGARTNDYDSAQSLTGYYDNSMVNYCHSLNEGGKTDWRVPTITELQDLNSAGVADRIVGPPGDPFFQINDAVIVWSSTSRGSSHYNAKAFEFYGPTTHNRNKGETNRYVYCIRP